VYKSKLSIVSQNNNASLLKFQLETLPCCQTRLTGYQDDCLVHLNTEDNTVSQSIYVNQKYIVNVYK